MIKAKRNFKQKIDDLKSDATKLFDISTCKCVMSVNCTCQKNPDRCEYPISINCTCEKSKKIPVIEQRFIYLQRMHRLGKIGKTKRRPTN